ncbi:hypothetical protein I6M45_07255 [Shewanella algae]|uniref:hypothetical protein n=1 Tax=Shewanella algae TaxID=38313 RepID=UPI001AACF854|nr:hypothetical protein [Shewanella algae]MBO2644924.1 hypothetical protein [Shewanella algae]
MRDFLYGALGMAFRNGTNLILIIVVTNYLGQGVAGEFLYALSFSMVLALIVDYSFNISVPLLAQDAPERVYNSLALKVLLGFLSLVILLLIINFSLYPYNSDILIVIYLSVMINSFSNFFVLVFRGQGEFLNESLMIVKNNSILLFISLAVMCYEASLLLLSLAYLLSRIIGFCVIFNGTKKYYYNIQARLKLMEVVYELKSGFTFAFLVGLGYLYVSLDTIALGYVVAPSDVAFYQILLQMALALCLTSNNLSQLYIVKFNNSRKSGDLNINYVKKVLAYSFLIGFVVALIYFFISPFVMGYIYKIKDSRVYDVVLFLSLIIILRHGIGILGAFITVCGTNLYRILSTMTGVVFLTVALLYYNLELSVEVCARLLFFSHVMIFFAMVLSTMYINMIKKVKVNEINL